MAENISRVSVWSARLRWTHVLLSASTLTLLLTGWLSASDATLAEKARGYHFLAAYVFSLSLIYRLYLLLAGKTSEHFQDCLPTAKYPAVAVQHLRFYLSLGKSELDGWFAHNPFWGPLYLLFFAFGIIMLLTGWSIGRIYMPGISLTGLHAFGSGVILVFTVAHGIAAVLHDARLDATSISALFSGNRYFRREAPTTSGPVEFKVNFPASPSSGKPPR